MGLVGLARGLAKELAPDNIRVNLVSPGIIETSREQTTYTPVAVSQTPGPLGRLGTVDDIASACLFLVSEDSGFITGQTLHVNGGAGVLG
jgi:3-oxoacyl-[acyl-carrier protein] reductase